MPRVGAAQGASALPAETGRMKMVEADAWHEEVRTLDFPLLTPDEEQAHSVRISQDDYDRRILGKCDATLCPS
jgi:hypothetical protein